MIVKCPECDGDVEVPNDVLVGEILCCPDCGLELEVQEIQGDQVKVAKAEIEGEDWGE